VSNKLYWKADPSVVVTSFVLTKSTDKAQSFSSLATITYDLAGANYEKKTKRFFYTDSSGAVGDAYRIVAVGANGTSSPVVVIAPADQPDFCTIVGYMLDTFGEVDTSIPVSVHSYGAGAWTTNPAGVVAQNPEALGLTAASQTVYPGADGIWQVRLIQKAYARITIPALDFDWAFIVPASVGPVNVRDIPLVRQADAYGLFPDQSRIGAGPTMA
jgi:hypothetical protein